jgi:hypothetical protein
MKIKIIIILLSSVILSGCGVYMHKQQTYYVHEVDPETQTQKEPTLSVQIVPTEKNFHILFIVLSQKWIAPYSIRFSAHSKQKPDSYFLLHSFKLKAVNDLIAEKQFSPPMMLKLIEKRMGDYVYHEVEYRYELGELLNFEKGKEVELEVTYEQPGVTVKKTIRLKGTGEETKEKSSLWNAYMSV